MNEKTNFIKKLYRYLLSDRSQDRAIIRLLNKIGANKDFNIVEVGCGYGNNLKVMRNNGLFPVGIEINENIAQAVRKDDFKCYSPEDEKLINTEFDVILMSHIIEHFDYNSLYDMMNYYLDRLKPGGHLIIATPLLGRRFYDNFDHVKPYTPIAIEEVFGRRGLQVQYQSKHELELIDLWLRRRALHLQLFSSLLRRKMSFTKIVLGSVNIGLALLHIFTLRLIGSTDAWAGLYRKVP